MRIRTPRLREHDDISLDDLAANDPMPGWLVTVTFFTIITMMNYIIIDIVPSRGSSIIDTSMIAALLLSSSIMMAFYGYRHFVDFENQLTVREEQARMRQWVRSLSNADLDTCIHNTSQTLLRTDAYGDQKSYWQTSALLGLLNQERDRRRDQGHRH